METPDTEQETLTTQQVENRLRSHLAAISAGWDQMLTDPPAARPGQRTKGTGATLEDGADSDEDMPRLLRVIEDRAQVTATLNGWCRVTIEDHHVEHGIPDGTSAVAMCDFLTRWAYLLAEHEAAEDLLAELGQARGTVARWCSPTQHRPYGWHPRPRSMRLGSCPLTWQHPDTADDQQCPGTLRGREDGWVTCDACGTAAVMGWWERKLHGEGGLPPMTLAQVVTYLHHWRGITITERGLRRWISDGDLVPVDPAPGVTHTYDVGAVEAALTRRSRRVAGV